MAIQAENVLNNPAPEPSVPRAWTCEAHADLVGKLERQNGLLERAHEDHLATQKQLAELTIALASQVLRTAELNGLRAKDIALLKEQAKSEAKHEAIVASRRESIGIMAVGLAVREGIHRVFGW